MVRELDDLDIVLEGETNPWRFSVPCSCGRVVDGIGLSHLHPANGGTLVGACMRREDALRLRDWLDTATKIVKS